MKTGHREDMILFNVLNNEVVFEEYFCNLLSINSFRDLFIEFILEKNKILNKEDIQYSNFDTEIILDNDCGRADLFLKLKNKEFIFEIKNKDYTKLTSKQPESYLKYLENNCNSSDFNKHLFFLIPIGYKHKDEIVKRWNSLNNFHSIEKQIFYWQDFLLKLKEDISEQSLTQIKMFYEFCEYWFNMKPIKFTNEEQSLFKTKGRILNDFKDLSVPRLIKKLEKVVRNVGDNSSMREDSTDLGFFYSCIVGDYKIWFGIDYDYWETNEVPLSLLIQNHTNGYESFELNLEGIKLEKFKDKVSNISEEYFGYYVGDLEKLGTSNYQNSIIKTIANIKVKIINQT